MKTLYLYLAEEYLGELAVDHVRGRETYVFRYDPAYLRSDRPLIDPSIQNVTGPQYPLTNGIFGFLADVAPDRWGRKLIRRREQRTLTESDFVLGVCDLTQSDGGQAPTRSSSFSSEAMPVRQFILQHSKIRTAHSCPLRKSRRD